MTITIRIDQSTTGRGYNLGYNSIRNVVRDAPLREVLAVIQTAIQQDVELGRDRRNYANERKQ